MKIIHKCDIKETSNLYVFPKIENQSDILVQNDKVESNTKHECNKEKSVINNSDGKSIDISRYMNQEFYEKIKEDGYKRGKEEGYEEGLNDGYEKCKKDILESKITEYEELKSKIESSKTEAKNQLVKMLNDNEKDILEFIKASMEKILFQTISEDKIFCNYYNSLISFVQNKDVSYEIYSNTKTVNILKNSDVEVSGIKIDENLNDYDFRIETSIEGMVFNLKDEINKAYKRIGEC